MNIKNQELYEAYTKNNQDSFGICIMNVANRVMQLLDSDPTPLHNGYYPDIHTAHGLICKADDDIRAGGITGYMASAVAHTVIECHVRGEEFRKSHNGEYKGEGTVNHAVLSVR